MARRLVLASLFGMAGAACAQSSVTAYGLLDAGINHVSGLKGGSVTHLVSGVMEGSRLGFRGNEDLGGGWRAIFTIETRVEADTGSVSNRPPSGNQVPDRLASASLLGLPRVLQPAVDGVANLLGSQIGVNLGGTFWDRQAFVGLVTPVGAVLAGRQYTPAYQIGAIFDTPGTQSSLSAAQTSSFPPPIDIRQSNTVAYRIETGPFAAMAMLGAGEGSTTTGRFAGAMAMYTGEALGVGLGYNTRKNEFAEKSLTTAVVGAWVALGPGRLHGLYVAVKDDHPTGLGTIAATLTPAIGAPAANLVQGAYVRALKQDARQWQLGYKLPIAAHTLYFVYNRWNDRTPANADVSTYGAVFTYALSKRTDLNFVLAHFDNRNLAQVAPGGAGFTGGVTAKAGTDSNNVALGLRHRF